MLFNVKIGSRTFHEIGELDAAVTVLNAIDRIMKNELLRMEITRVK